MLGSRIIAKVCGCLLAALAITAHALSPLRPMGFADPRPFRLDDAQTGRDFDYNSESFLHRFTYRPLAPPRTGLAEDREGLYGSAGSTKSNELYAVMQLQKSLPLDNAYFLRYRFLRDEDFDGRYDRNLLGVGRDFAQDWSFIFSGDVQGDKARIDMEAELSWRGNGSHARFALVAPDALFNDKQREAQYSREPYTGFVDLRWQVRSDASVWTFINHNTPTRMHNESQDQRFHYRQTAAGVGVDSLLGRHWQLSAWLEGETSRRQHATLSGATESARLNRRYRELGAQLSRRLTTDLEGWTGARLLRFDETGRHTPDVLDEQQTQREEALFYVGFSWDLAPAYRFHPGLYLNFIDNTEIHPAAPERDRHEDGFEGKLALPLELTVHRASGATLTINPTLRLHRLAFGGGNIQARIPL